MPRNFHRKLAVLSRVVPYVEFNRAENGLITYWDTQDQSGSVALVTNPALTLASRSVALVTIADYTLNANWANPSGQIARHSTGSTATLQQDDILAPGKTFQVTITLANRTAGSITITDGGAAISANEQTTRTITSTGTDFIITPTTDFDGDIDVSILLVQQTDIAASSDFPRAELLDESGASGTATAANWTVGNNATLTNPSAGILRVTKSTPGNPFASQDVMTIGKRFRVPNEARSDGNAIPQIRSDGAGDVLWTGVNTTGDWQAIDLEWLPTGTIFRLGAITVTGTEYCEFRNTSVTEANPLNGDYTGVSLGIPSGTRLEYLVSSDGVNDNLSIDSAELNSFINWDNLSFDMWAIADTWAAGTDYLFNFGIDSNNYFRGYRTGANLIIEHKAGGTQKSITKASGSPSGLFHFGGSINTASGGTITLLYNGLPGGTATGLGTMVGNLSSDETVIGAFNDSGSNSWAGDYGHPTLFNITLTNNDWIRRFEAGGV